MPENVLNPLSEFLAGLDESERTLVTFALGLQLEGPGAHTDSEQQDLLESRILKEAETPVRR